MNVKTFTYDLLCAYTNAYHRKDNLFQVVFINKRWDNILLRKQEYPGVESYIVASKIKEVKLKEVSFINFSQQNLV